MKKIRLLILLGVFAASGALAQGGAHGDAQGKAVQDKALPLQSSQNGTSEQPTQGLQSGTSGQIERHVPSSQPSQPMQSEQPLQPSTTTPPFRHADAQVLRTDSVVTVSFELSIDKDGLRRDETLTLTPELYNATHQQTLPSVELFRQRTEWINYRLMRSEKGRERLLNGKDSIAHRLVDGGKISYEVHIPYDSVLNHSLLRLVCTPVMGLREKALYWVQLTTHPSLLPEQEPIFTPQVEALSSYTFTLPVTSHAEGLSKEYSFVAPMQEYEKSKKSTEKGLFDPDMPLNMGKGESDGTQSAVEQFIERNEQGAIQINFELNRTTINYHYQDNNNSLAVLASVLKQIQGSQDSRVEKVIIAGFASPEGPLSYNDRLAWGRAEAVRDFVVNNSNIKPSNIQLYNGSEDWRGLRKLIQESDIKHREKLLDIIDNVPILKGREKQLMDVGTGEPGRYMAKYFFPKLRNAAYIKVYYAPTPAAATTSSNLHQAIALMQESKYNAALELLSNEQALPGGDVENMMGICAIQLHEFDRAREYLQAAVNKGCQTAVQNLRSITLLKDHTPQNH